MPSLVMCHDVFMGTEMRLLEEAQPMELGGFTDLLVLLPLCLTATKVLFKHISVQN